MMDVGSKPRANLKRLLPEGEPMGIVDIHDALIIREGDVFLVTDKNGNIPRENEQGLGLYHADMRHLSVFNFYFHTAPPVVLLSTAEPGFASEHILTNPKLRMSDGNEIPRNSIEVRRQRAIADCLREQLQVTNFHSDDVTLELRLELGADFADIFEVRGFAAKRRGRLAPPVVTADEVTFQYRGLDKAIRRTTVRFSTQPKELSASAAVFHVTLGPRETWSAEIVVSFDRGRASPPYHSGRDHARDVAGSYDRWLQSCTQVFTDNEFFNKAFIQSLRDLRMLWDETEEGVRFPAAGTPWFDALFGRDSLIISLQTLAFRPEIARETLKALARWQGSRLDPGRDEEPGKILHEYRRGEVSQSGQLPFSPYYGTIDATLLFLLLAAEYYRWTADRRLLQELRPHLLAAIGWLYEYGDLDRDGYVEYEKRAERGLVNQGWKDSHDAIVHADGSLASAPIALVEVQGYLYAAKRRLAPVLEMLGLTELARQLETEAGSLRRRFQADFWLSDLGFYALALDGQKHPCSTVASNVGHALWTGIVSRTRAAQVIERMLANDLFSGWGIRTVSHASPRYNPLGYHLGAVWPHDNAIAAFGFKMYGFEEGLNEVATGLFDAALSFPYYRLPELFGGQARADYQTPVPYPVACRPQGWAAGAFPMLLHAILGLQADGPSGVLQIVRPRLPYWLNTVELHGLRVGRGQVDLLYRRRGERTHVEVLETTGDISVSLKERWVL